MERKWNKEEKKESNRMMVLRKIMALALIPFERGYLGGK